MQVLQFSGGKDSLACLFLLKHKLHEITVLWLDSGDSFPESYAQMEEVKKLCPNFKVIKGRQPEIIAEHGYPVDLLPVRNHSIVQINAQQSRPKLQSFFDCCYRSVMAPLHEATLAMGATMIIRGQKLVDEHKSPLRNGDVVDGVRYFFPLEDWSDAQVYDYLEQSNANHLLPKHYSEANTSLDCQHCTAYLAENSWKRSYLKKCHPKVHKEVQFRMNIIYNEISTELFHMKESNYVG